MPHSLPAVPRRDGFYGMESPPDALYAGERETDRIRRRVPDADRIRSVEILGAERATAAYGEVGANGAPS